MNNNYVLLRFDISQREFAKRCGIAMFQENLSIADRVRILKRSAPFLEIDCFDQSRNFQEQYYQYQGTAILSWLVGVARIRSDCWRILQAILGGLPKGVSYLRAYLDEDDDQYTILETDMPELQHEIGNKLNDPTRLIALMGLVPSTGG
jgi:hypothetical protein